jgi:Domain of unknown function (DUF4193)
MMRHRAAGDARAEPITDEQERTLEDEEEYIVEEEEDFPEDVPEGELAEEPAEEEEGGDESLEDILAKRPEERVVAVEEEDDSVLSLDREERLETLAVRVIPKQESEFVCQKCHLVKPIRSQLKDRERMYCRDCA